MPPPASIGYSGVTASDWPQSDHYLNLLAEYKLSKQWTFFVDWENLERNFEDSSEEGTSRRPYHYKWDPWKIFFGLRFET